VSTAAGSDRVALAASELLSSQHRARHRACWPRSHLTCVTPSSASLVVDVWWSRQTLASWSPTVDSP